MNINLILPLLSLVTGWVSSFSVIGSPGGKVKISCDRPSDNDDSPRYFCRGPKSNCVELIRTDLSMSWEHSGRFSIQNYNSYTWVIFKDLTTDDEGTYHCGVRPESGPDVLTEVNLSIRDVSGLRSVQQVSGVLGGNVSITCFYPAELKDSEKDFCEEWDREKTMCYTKVSLQPNQISSTNGKFSMTDNPAGNFYTVTISNLSEEDTLTYWCREGRKETGGQYEAFTTQILLSVQGQLSSFPVTSSPGATVYITCSFHQFKAANAKYFCREWERGCYKFIRTDKKKEWEHSGRFSVFSTDYGHMKIYIRDVTPEDEGTYYCGVEEESGPDSCRQMVLTVKDVAGQSSVQQPRAPGEDVVFTCYYPPNIKLVKALCKEVNSTECTPLGYLEARQLSRQWKRFSFLDNPAGQYYTVTLAGVTKEDSGTYRCQVESEVNSGKYYYLISPVELEVTAYCTSLTFSLDLSALNEMNDER